MNVYLRFRLAVYECVSKIPLTCSGLRPGGTHVYSSRASPICVSKIPLYLYMNVSKIPLTCSGLRPGGTHVYSSRASPIGVSKIPLTYMNVYLRFPLPVYECM